MSCSLPKQAKIRKRTDFLRISRSRRRVFGSSLRVDWVENPSLEGARLGITVSRRYGNAVARNRFKRVVREVFRLSRFNLPCTIEINVAPLGSAREISFSEFKNELLSLIARCC